MNRTQLVKAVAEETGLSQTDVDTVLEAFQKVVGEVVAAGEEKLTIQGFLSFEQVARAARTGRNPRTGEPVEIAASKAVKVTAGSKLKAVAAGG